MKKRIALVLAAGFLVVFLSSCATTVEYIGYVTIYNKGNLSINASVSGESNSLEAGTYATWDVSMSSSSGTSVELYAEQADDTRYSVSETVTITDGQVYLWTVGWYSE